jgi:hypothetical protein
MQSKPGVVEEFVPHTALDMKDALLREYKLVRKDVCHVCVADNVLTVYHSAQNSTYANYVVRRGGAYHHVWVLRLFLPDLKAFVH